MEFPQMGSGPNRQQIIDALRNTAQSASNNIAETASMPVDAIAWALRKAGVPIGDKPMMGSDWMREKGLTAPVQEGASKVVGDTIGMLAPAGLTKAGAQAMMDVGSKLKGLPVGMSIKDVSGTNAAGQAANAATDYRMSHTAPNSEFGAPLHDLTGGGQMYPADVYSPRGMHIYGTGYPAFDREAFSIANKAKGNPDAEVVMYRAVPKGVSAINPGDWVTLSKGYAKNHGESVLDNAYDILEQKVKAKELYTNADSIHEFGYQPFGGK